VFDMLGRREKLTRRSKNVDPKCQGFGLASLVLYKLRSIYYNFQIKRLTIQEFNGQRGEKQSQ